MIDQNSQFFAILTAVGEAKQANATALGLSWTFSQMGVGDANGTDPIPNRAQTKLINEWRRAPVNQVRPDPANPNIIITEQVIPADVGGRWIRELALYDADGDMVAVANCAPSFKPLLVQGTGKTQVIRMNFIVASTANIVLKIDPAVVLATREYVDLQIIEALAKLDFKHSVLVATTANIALSGIQTIDGVVLPADARVLVKDQTQAKDNGIYVVPAGGVWKRAQDADASVEVTPGLFVSVEQGASHGDSIWQLVTDAPIVLGTTALTFEVVAGRTGVVAGTYRSLTVDRNGRVIAGTNPTTLAGSGITDGATKTALAEAIAGVVAKTGATLSGSLILSNGTNDSPEFGWENTTTKAYMDVVNNSLRVFGSTDGGDTLIPLDLNLKTKSASVFGNPLFHSGNFDPSVKADKAKTLDGYGITDAVSKKGSVVGGAIEFNNGTSDSPEVAWRTPSSYVFMDVFSDNARICAGYNGESLNPLRLHLPTKAAYLFDHSVWTAGNFDPAGKLNVGDGGIVAKSSPQAVNVNDLPYGGLWSINPGTVGAPFANGSVIHCAYDVASGNWTQIFADMGGGSLSWRGSLNRSISRLKTLWDSDNFTPASKINGVNCSAAGLAYVGSLDGDPHMTAANGSVVFLASKAYSVLGFQFVKGPTGYIKLPDFLGGFMLQWTKTPQLSTQATYTWNFPVRFPNEVFGVSGTMIGVSQGPLEVSVEPTTSSVGFAIGIVTAAVGRSYVWAWGY